MFPAFFADDDTDSEQDDGDEAVLGEAAGFHAGAQMRPPALLQLRRASISSLDESSQKYESPQSLLASSSFPKGHARPVYTNAGHSVKSLEGILVIIN